MSEIIWLTADMILTLHNELIREHGGSPGLRDRGLLESALDRAKNMHAYVPDATLPQLAAACGYGILKNHPFIDGNKRAGFICVFTFLGVNGLHLHCPEEEAYRMTLDAASGDITEDEFVEWIARSVVPWND